jgi:hypothetical protein
MDAILGRATAAPSHGLPKELRTSCHIGPRANYTAIFGRTTEAPPHGLLRKTCGRRHIEACAIAQAF